MSARWRGKNREWKGRKRMKTATRKKKKEKKTNDFFFSSSFSHSFAGRYLFFRFLFSNARVVVSYNFHYLPPCHRIFWPRVYAYESEIVTSNAELFLHNNMRNFFFGRIESLHLIPHIHDGPRVHLSTCGNDRGIPQNADGNVAIFNIIVRFSLARCTMKLYTCMKLNWNFTATRRKFDYHTSSVGFFWAKISSNVRNRWYSYYQFRIFEKWPSSFLFSSINKGKKAYNFGRLSDNVSTSDMIPEIFAKRCKNSRASTHLHTSEPTTICPILIDGTNSARIQKRFSNPKHWLKISKV